MKKYQKQIGDGKLPNKYFVFQYDQKFKRVRHEDDFIEVVLIKEDTETKDRFVGEFKTYKEALTAVDNKAYLPNVVIEDRLTGVIFEQQVIVCQECGREDCETMEDISFTKKTLEEKGIDFN